MGSRRQAREYALQALYQCDTLEDWADDTIGLFFSTFYPDLASDAAERSRNCEFLHTLVGGVATNLNDIDSFISLASENWSLDRMARVDRNILRLGVFEICFMPDIPPNVSINEAIEVSKRFGSDESPMFINGVLDRIATDFKMGVFSVERVAQAAPSKKVINE